MASPTASGVPGPATPWSSRVTHLGQPACARSSTAHPLPCAVAATGGCTHTPVGVFSTTQALLPAIETIFAHTVQPCRRVAPSPFCKGGKDWHHEGHGRLPLGHGGMGCVCKRPGTGETRVQGPGGATWHRVSALGLDALPVTIGTSPVGQCPSLLLTTRMCLCGGA